MIWLQTHKHLAICIIVAAFALYAVAKVTAHLDGVAHDQRVLAEAQLAQDKKAQVAAETQAQKDRQAYDLLKTQLDSQNAQLRSQITALSVALASRQAQDKALPPPELAARWESIVGLPGGSVKATPEGYLATLTAGTSTVVMLEEVPADRQTIANQEKLIANDKQELASIQTALVSSQAAVIACKQTQAQQEITCNAEKKEIKDQARRGKWKAFGAGVLAAVGIIFGVHH